MLSAEDNELLCRVEGDAAMGQLMRRALDAGVPVRGSRRARRRAGARAPAGRGSGRVSRHRRAGSACSTSIARTGARRSRWAATRNAACAASITAGKSTSKATSSTARRSRTKPFWPRRSSTRPIPAAKPAASSGSGWARPTQMRDFEPPAWAPSPGGPHQHRQDPCRLQLGAGARRRDRFGAQLEPAFDRHGAGAGRRAPARPRASGCGRRPTRRRGCRCSAPTSAFAMSRYAGRSSDADTHDYLRITLVRRAVHRADPAQRPLQAVDPQHSARRHATRCSISSPGARAKASTQEAWREFCRPAVGVDLDANFRSIRTRDNDYLQDREAMKHGSHTGIAGIPNQDIAMWETMGPIADRSRERLGASDMAIVQFRRIMVDAARAVSRRRTGDRHRRRTHVAHVKLRVVRGYRSQNDRLDDARRRGRGAAGARTRSRRRERAARYRAAND